MKLQARLKKIMRRRNMRVADLARHLDEPCTTVREWVLFGRVPGDMRAIEVVLRTLEK